jgi:hypothetical protein
MRSSELSLEITQFYPDTLMNLECLILFKYKTTSKLIQFENFFEQKPPKFELVHKENNQNAYIDYKIYGGGDRKVFLGGGSIKLIHSLFNHSTVKLIERGYTCILTNDGREFLFPFNNSSIDKNNANFRMEITIKNNLYKEKVGSLFGKVDIINNHESDSVHILNESEEESFLGNNSMITKLKSNKANSTNIHKSQEIMKKKEEITKLIYTLSPINKQSIDIILKNKDINNESNFEPFFEEKESNFDSFLERPEIYGKANYPPKKDFSAAKSSYEQKIVLLHDLFNNKEGYYLQYNKNIERQRKLRDLIFEYQSQLLKQQKKLSKLREIRNQLTEKSSSLNIIDKFNSNILSNDLKIQSMTTFFLKRIFSIKYSKGDVYRGIQSKYKEKDIKEVLLKAFDKINFSTIKLLSKEKLNKFISLNTKFNFISNDLIRNIVEPENFKLDQADTIENKLTQEDFDLLYKNKKQNINDTSRNSFRKKTVIKQSFTGIRNNSFVMKSDKTANILEIDFIEKSNDLKNKSFDNDLNEYIEEFLDNHPNFKAYELERLDMFLYKINNEKFILERGNETDKDSFYAITSKGRVSLSVLLKKHSKLIYKNLNKQTTSVLLKKYKSNVKSKVKSSIQSKKFYSPKIKINNGADIYNNIQVEVKEKQ